MVPHRSSPDGLRTGCVGGAEQQQPHDDQVIAWTIVESELFALNDGDVLNQRRLVMTRTLAGYLTGACGREMVFGLYLNNVMAPDVLNDSLTIIADHGAIVEEIYTRT